MFPWKPALFAAAIAAHPAQSCNLKHVLEFSIEDGHAIIFLNDVYYRKFVGPDENVLGFAEWNIQGENRVHIRFEGDQSAMFQIRSACAGGFGSQAASSKADLSGGGEVAFSVHLTKPGNPLFEALEPGDPDGLAAAYDAFRDTVLARDAQAVLSALQLVIDRSVEGGLDRDALVAHLIHAVTEGIFDLPENSTFYPAADGRIFQRLTDGYDVALTSRYKYDGSAWTQPLGTYWARIDGEWSIILN
ncbi:hypothetical protein [Ruegeria lacuscaerulensis]|uniref:hypothetical protein n=1 Tax=Ruegeria lacuscaerulensis TaxID=55218 RepID=UPI0014813F8C|nr:hypothetical protein [Ruegeria lacuscaerulensis]